MQLPLAFPDGQAEIPSKLIVEVGELLGDLRLTLRNPELPCIDFDALLEHVIDAVRHSRSAASELYFLPTSLMTNEMLNSRVGFPQPKTSDSELEDMWENVLGLDLVASLAKKLGHQVLNTFRLYKLFEDDYLRYEYDGILNDTTLVLRARR